MKNITGMGSDQNYVDFIKGEILWVATELEAVKLTKFFEEPQSVIISQFKIVITKFFTSASEENFQESGN